MQSPGVNPHDDIPTPRLILRGMSVAFLEASLRGDVEQAQAALGLAAPSEWFTQKRFIALRRDGCCTDPAYLPWSVRAIGLRATGEMIGHIGFHSRPDPPYLRELAPGAVEFGYEVAAAHRRQGYATEAICGLMTWAATEHAVERFVVSISPANTASTALAAKLGFLRIGGHEDEFDGYEDIYLLHWSDARRHTYLTPANR
jgi:RimJ/RimL family protein N-acetyltransferase